jgi:hypothetical protein
VISTFGSRARAFAAGLEDLEAVITDVFSLGQAYGEAVRRRELGRPFYGMVLWEEPRALTTLSYAQHVFTQIADADTRRLALEALGAGTLLLGQQKAADLWVLPERTAVMINEFLSLCNGTLVRSYAEAARLRVLSARPHSIEPVVSAPKVALPGPRTGERTGIVVWVPDHPAAYATWYALALAEFSGEVTCVTASRDVPPDLPARFIGTQDPALAEILRDAGCVVCGDPDDPGAAVAFARAGYGVAAPLSSGAQEYVRDVASFSFTHQRDIEIAAKMALRRPASVRFVPQPLAAPAIPALPLSREELPLVSIVVSTYNRPDDLTNCMRDLARQTYPNLEIVVVNDAGENVDHVVAPYPKARIVNLPVNGGQEALLIKAFGLVRGTYVQLLADDDTLFPDHVERVMAAILRSGAQIAHANTLIRYEERGPGGQLTVTGYNAIVFSDSTTPTEALISTPVAGQSLIIHRDTVDAVGGYSDKTLLADQEFQMRLATRYVFAYADATTNEWRVRGGENRSARTDGGAELRRVYDEFYPVPGRPMIQEQRRKTLEGFAARPKGFIFGPTVRIERPA